MSGLLYWMLMPTAIAVEPCPVDKPQIAIKEAVEVLRSTDIPKQDHCVHKTTDAHWTPYFKALSGALHLRSSQAPDAVQDFQVALSSDLLLGPIREQTMLRLAVALGQIEDYEGATQVLAKLLSGERGRPGRLPKPEGVDPGEVRWVLAKMHRTLQETDAERKILETLWTHNPTSTFESAAVERLTEMGHPIDPSNTGGQALYSKRIATLESLYRPKEALLLREKLPKSHALQRQRAFAGAVFKSKDYHRATQLLEALPSPTDDEKVLLALAKVRSGDPKGSVNVYRKLAASGGSKAELAQYKLGYMAWDQGEMEESIALFKDYSETYPAGKYRDTALWFTGMAQIQLGETRAANRTFKMLEVSHPVSSLRPGSVYWQAMTSQDSSRDPLLKKVQKVWPKSGYAWFASKTLQTAFPAKTGSWEGQTVVDLEHHDWDIGTRLSEVGLHSWARPHLERLSQQTSKWTKQQRIALANALIASGSYKKAKRLVRNWCGNPATATDITLIRACWPKPHGSAVQKMATDAGLPAYLPFAIMTAESALDPGVTSPAGARGLMQLMPFLAEELHGSLWPDRPFDPDEMYSATYNATLGTTELIRLAEQFSDLGVEPLPMVIAGYNGGSDAVGRWIESYQSHSNSNLTDWNQRPIADAWAEFIGYSETRKYVRRVLGFMQTYRLAYGDPPNQPESTSKSTAPGIKANGSAGVE